MLFNSYIFIFAALPVFIFGYFFLNRFKKYTAAKIWLTLCSLFYYGYFNFAYLWIIISSIILNFGISKLLLRFIGTEKSVLRKFLCALGVIINIGVLFYYKYFDFMIMNVNTFFGSDFTYMNLILPLGISFFTFQQISYVLDSYKASECNSSLPPPDYSFVDYALFVTFFPQLIAGPIVLHDEMLPQFADEKNKHIDFENISKGLMAFSFGLAKKVIVADNFGKIVDYGYSSISSLTSAEAVLAIIGYTIQIYFDFSGYCDMASGIALLFNIKLPMNFNSPYKALDIVDFWKRWHITLTRFLTKYVYIPLGGNRKGTVRTYVNILIVFLVSGIWHGAGYSFIIWGLMHGIANMTSRAMKRPIEKTPKFLRWFITFIFVCVSWVFFRAESLTSAVKMLEQVFAGGFGVSAELSETIRQPAFLNVFIQIAGVPSVLFAFAALCIILASRCKNTNERLNGFKPNIKTMLSSLILFIYSIFSLSGISSFLYYNF